MTFEGFPDDGLVFYEGLEADNSRTYWMQHRAQYDTSVRAPLLALVEELAAEFGAPTVFRPYRDVRFSKDKTPYKTHQGAVLHADGAAPGAVYVQLSADGLRVAGGCWRLQPDQVDRYRRAVADEIQGPRLAAEVDRLRGLRWDIGGDRLIRAPRGWPADHERIDLLRHKSLSAAQDWQPADWLHSRGALDRVRGAWRQLTGLNAWFADNVGATTAAPDRRR